MATVRYLVDDVDASLRFYAALGFTVAERWGPPFVMLSRGDLTLWLSGPGTSASLPLADGSMPVPGGWNRVVIEVADIRSSMQALRPTGARFRSGPIQGPGGQQVLVEDPSGNPIELFQARDEQFATTGQEVPVEDTRHVSLHEITAKTVREVTSLAVGPNQQRFVATNAVSLSQALFSEEAWYRVIHADESPAGFVMLYDESLRVAPPAAPKVALWRFMIDYRFQGRGIGAAALQRAIAHVRGKGLFSSLTTSFVPGPGCPEPFYLRAGFRPTGRIDDGEVVLELPLLPDVP